MRRLLITVALAASLAAPSQASAKPGDLYVGVPDDPDGKVVRVNPKTGAQHVVASGHGLIGPDGGDFTKSGKLVIADYDADAVFKINPKTGKVSPFAMSGQFHGPTDVTVDPRGNVYAVDPFAGTALQGAIFRVAGGHAHLVSDGQFFSGGPLGLDFAHNRIYTEDQDAGPGGSGAVMSVKPATGHQRILSSGHHLDGPYGMTLAPNNKVAYLSDEANNSVVRVKLSTGKQHVVASGGKIDGPTGVALGLDGKLYLANDGDGKILRVNPKSGHVSVLSEGGKLAPAGEGIMVQPR
jgi:DNA-binding beta-propeller fold protein YncE